MTIKLILEGTFNFYLHFANVLLIDQMYNTVLECVDLVCVGMLCGYIWEQPEPKGTGRQT